MKLYYLLDEYFHMNNKKNKSIGEKKVRNINYDEDDFIYTMHKIIIY